MSQSLLGQIFQLPSALRRKTLPDCQTIWLLGSRDYAVEVGGTAIHQAYLQSLLGGDPREPASRLLMANLERRWCPRMEQEMAFVHLGGVLVGYCAAAISARYVAWLSEWQLERAEVWCSLRLQRAPGSYWVPGLILASLDLDLPFRMKTVESRAE